MAGFIFGGETGQSADDLARRRKVIDALRANSIARMPANVGEGIYSFGTALVGRMKDRKLDPLEDEERARVSNQFDAITNSIMGGAQPSYTPAPVSVAPLDGLEQIGADTMAAIGRPSGGYRESLIGTESGGNFGARNNEVGAGGQRGHFGRVQFGHARLQDAMNAGAIPQGTTPEQFMASPELQMAAENWHFADLESQLAPYVGTVVNGQPLDMGALVAMGHLGGAAGARRFVETGGQYNPSDSFGTSLADYARIHGGQGGAPSGGQPRAQIVSQLAELMQNPYLSDTQKIIAQQLLGEQMQAPDPMAAIELERAQLELAQMRNPQAQQPEALIERQALAAQAGLQPGTPEYQAYILNGETQGGSAPPAGFASLDMQARAAGMEPGTPEYQEWMRTGGGGGVPAAFTALDLQAQASGFAPGTPEYQEFMATRGAGLAAAARTEGEAQAEAQIAAPGDIASAETTLGYIDSIRNHPGRGAGSGATSFLGGIPGSNAKEFQIEVERLKSGAFLTAIEQLRGMGALSNAEGQTATAAVAALDPSGSEEGFLKRLAEYEAIVQRGMERARARVPGGDQASPPPQSNDDAEFLRSLGLEP